MSVNKNPVTFSINLVQLLFAVGMEVTVEPITRGEFARLDERVTHMQSDIAWIRAHIEKDRAR